MNHHIWQPENGALLQQLRISAQLDELVFARSNAISLSQLRELEGHGHGSFYTPHIKSFTGYKLLKKLGHEPLAQAAVLATHDDQAPLVVDVQGLTPTAAHPVSSADTLFTPNFVTSLSNGLSASVAESDTSPFNKHSPHRRSHYQRLFMLLLSATAAWAIVNTPWATLIARMAPTGIDTSTIAIAPPLPTTAHAMQLQNASPTSLSQSPAHATPSQDRSGTAISPLTLSDGPACDWRHQARSFLYEPSDPVKAGNYIHFVALQDSHICVRDQQDRLTTLQLKAGMAKSIYGVPPFMVHSPSWASLQLFYQGRRVVGTPNGEAHWVFKNKALPTQGVTLTAVMAQTRP